MSDHDGRTVKFYARMAIIVGVVTFFVLVVMTVVHASAAGRFEDCIDPIMFRWDFIPQASDPPLIAFALYIYPAGTTPVAGKYFMLVPAIPTMETSLSCGRVFLPAPGTYQAHVTALYVTGEESDPSNIQEFTYGNQTPLPPILPPPPPKVPKPPAGLPLVEALPLVRMPPPLDSGGGLLTEQPAWNGAKAPRLGGTPITLPPVQSSPDGTLTLSCQWKGTCPK
jgi:hypothetical protein